MHWAKQALGIPTYIACLYVFANVYFMPDVYVTESA